jgi:hypothetical protein
MAKLLVEIKEAVEGARSRGHSALTEQAEVEYLRRYDKLVRRGLELNPECNRRRRVEPGRAKAKGGRGSSAA